MRKKAQVAKSCLFYEIVDARVSKDGFDFDQKKTSEKGKAAWSACKRSARKQTVPDQPS